MYWLKPFDSINDTANAMALLEFDWSKRPILEIGGGDGVFSFIMHGGEFNFSEDRYTQTDLLKGGDIYDVYKKESNLKIKKTAALKYDAGLDLKLSHLYKGRETMLYKSGNLISSNPERLPFKDNVFSEIFLYTFHGLNDYKSSLKEIKRILNKDGKLLVVAVNKIVRDNFICYRIHKYCQNRNWNRLSEYFLKLDCGRFDEIGGIFSKDLKEWRELFGDTGFKVVDIYSQVSPLLWIIYDTQTRPILRPLIRLSILLEKMRVKIIFKFLWIYIWMPLLVLMYIFFARPRRIGFLDNPKNIFLAIQLRAC
jgi:SAM-dependent methyltransferase